MEVTDKVKKQDKERTRAILYRKRIEREKKEDSICKLPNEFRYALRDYNHHNIYNGDSYCGLFAEDY